MTRGGQPWIRSAGFDSLFILGPAFLSVALVLFAGERLRVAELEPWTWLLLIVGIDVAHVYSTLYRTYFDERMRVERRMLLVAAPLVAWAVGAILYSLGALVFWRAAAYLAVFHFVRQQYGFLRIYGRDEPQAERADVWRRRLEALTVYAATVYPLIYWHASAPRKFHWFVDGDFWTADLPVVRDVALGVYVLLLIGYGASQVMLWRRHAIWNGPKNLLVLGTAVSWYIGIVAFDGDAVFTLTNVVSHGIPYTALIWATKRREGGPFFRWGWVPAFLAVLFLFAYAEEWLWDVLIWRDHPTLFAWVLPQVQSPAILVGLIPLLIVPQVTHYLLDGFLWRRPRA